MTRSKPPHAFELRHLRREVRTALELAVVASAPADLTDRLASSAGLLEVLSELPADGLPGIAWIPKTVERADDALEEWRRWQTNKLKGSA